MTVADLITQNCCTAACVAAVTSPARCKCPCNGQFHGLVTNADVTTLVDARRAGLNQLSDHEVLSIERRTA